MFTVKSQTLFFAGGLAAGLAVFLGLALERLLTLIAIAEDPGLDCHFRVNLFGLDCCCHEFH